MKYVKKYPRIMAGMHAPDEKVYRAEVWRPCVICGEMTDWVDASLAAHVCSEECHFERATGRKPPSGG